VLDTQRPDPSNLTIEASLDAREERGMAGKPPYDKELKRFEICAGRVTARASGLLVATAMPPAPRRGRPPTTHRTGPERNWRLEGTGLDPRIWEAGSGPLFLDCLKDAPATKRDGTREYLEIALPLLEASRPGLGWEMLDLLTAFQALAARVIGDEFHDLLPFLRGTNPHGGGKADQIVSALLSVLKTVQWFHNAYLLDGHPQGEALALAWKRLAEPSDFNRLANGVHTIETGRQLERRIKGLVRNPRRQVPSVGRTRSDRKSAAMGRRRHGASAGRGASCSPPQLAGEICRRLLRGAADQNPFPEPVRSAGSVWPVPRRISWIAGLIGCLLMAVSHTMDRKRPREVHRFVATCDLARRRPERVRTVAETFLHVAASLGARNDRLPREVDVARVAAGLGAARTLVAVVLQHRRPSSREQAELLVYLGRGAGQTESQALDEVAEIAGEAREVLKAFLDLMDRELEPLLRHEHPDRRMNPYPLYYRM